MCFTAMCKSNCPAFEAFSLRVDNVSLNVINPFADFSFPTGP